MFSKNNNTEIEQMPMMNPGINSNYFNEYSSQYQTSLPPHQTSSPYGPSTYYRHQQRSIERPYYGQNQNPMTQTFQSEQVLSYHQQTQSTYLPSASSIYKSPSRTSISSYVPDELDSSNSSISDNASTSNVKISHIKPLEVLKKLCEMGPEQERTIFVDRLQKLWDEHNLICRKLPSLSRQTIDLYRLYTLIREQNGFEQFSKSAKTHQWREIASKLNIPIAPTTAYHLRKKYIQLKLFHYECKYDRAGIDPEPILAEIHENNESQQQVPTLTNQVSASFPVESTYIKRRKLTSEDLHMSHSSIDSNKLLMSLRGGLLAETTWALDTLNILLTDDQTYTYFRLIEMPGLLSALVDIYIKCLRELFDEFQIKSDPILENSKQEQNHVLYRIESDCLNSYNKQKNIVYDYQENINDNPENVLDLQNLDDLSYIQTHFDPLPTDDNSSTLFTRYSFGYQQISSRCICVSSILRNLSFLPGNDLEFIQHKTFIYLLARLLSLRHDCSHYSWSEFLIILRENTLVTLANISGVFILDQFDSDLINLLTDSLLYWSTCNSNEYQISSQRLSIEILTKLSIHEMNIDFILATPPFSRIRSLLNILIEWLNVDTINNHILTQREFAIVLLNALIQCNSNLIHSIEHIPYLISLLLKFLEDYVIKTNEKLFTTDDMLIRTGNCLLLMMNCRKNVKKYEDRILNLSISNVIHPDLRRILLDILHYC